MKKFFQYQNEYKSFTSLVVSLCFTLFFVGLSLIPDMPNVYTTTFLSVMFFAFTFTGVYSTLNLERIVDFFKSEIREYENVCAESREVIESYQKQNLELRAELAELKYKTHVESNE